VSKKVPAILKTDARLKALCVAETAIEKHAGDVSILQIGAFSALTDYLVICSAESGPQIQAIREAVDGVLSGNGLEPLGIEGQPEHGWVLVDYNDVILHIMKPDTRAFYNLERLWGDAPTIPLRPPQEKARKP